MTRQDTMLLEIRDQPALLRRLRERAAGGLVPQSFPVDSARPIWFVGCGDMHFAALTAAAVAECGLRRPARALESMAMRWWHERLGPGDLVVAASISGRTPRTVEAVKLAAKAGAATLAVTDNAGSPVAEAASHTLLLETAPPEALDDAVYPGYAALVPQTRSYTAVLYLFLLLAGAAERETSLSGIPEELDSFLEEADRSAGEKAKAILEGAPLGEVLVLGSGPFAGTAAYGAAKLLEYAIPAHAQCIEEFHHLEMFTVDEGTWLSVLAPDAPSARRWEEVRGAHQALGARSLEWCATGADASLPARSLPVAVFLATLALQLQAYHVARCLGRDVNRWVGGVRHDLIFQLSNRTVRGSRVDA